MRDDVRPEDDRGVKRWRKCLLAMLVLALSWQAWVSYFRWKHTIRLTLPDGSPAAHASVSIWVSGWSLPINHQGGGFAGRKSKWPPNADEKGIYRLNRRWANEPSGLYISTAAWKDGREYKTAIRLESAKTTAWPVRLTLHPAR